MSDCVICCEILAKSISCQFCEFETCSTCCKRYLLDTESDPHCMSCKKQWSRDFIDKSFTKSFVNKELKCHREEVLLDREKSLLPATQHLVESELHKRKYRKIISDLYEKRKKLQQELNETNDLIRDSYNHMYYGEEKSQEKAQFIRKCPAENCMGYLSSQWKCGLCNMWSCPDCHEIKGETKDTEHVCNPDDVETAKLINKETKPCPSCGTRIFKIDGCDQMFCTSCQTPFSWRTGQKVITGAIHNPHYYEWMRNQNNGEMARQPGDIRCGGIPSIYLVQSTGKRLKLNANDRDLKQVYNIHRVITHMQYTELERYNVIENNNNTNSDLRIEYMLKEIDEKSFKMTLQKREKKNNKNIEINQIIRMFIDTATDIIKDIVEIDNIENLQNILNTCESLRQYVNTSVKTVSERYKCVVPQIYSDWIVNNTKV